MMRLCGSFIHCIFCFFLLHLCPFISRACFRAGTYKFRFLRGCTFDSLIKTIDL